MSWKQNSLVENHRYSKKIVKRYRVKYSRKLNKKLTHQAIFQINLGRAPYSTLTVITCCTVPCTQHYTVRLTLKTVPCTLYTV